MREREDTHEGSYLHQDQLPIVPVNGWERWLGYLLKSLSGFQMLYMSLFPPVRISHLNPDSDFRGEYTLYDN